MSNPWGSVYWSLLQIMLSLQTAFAGLPISLSFLSPPTMMYASLDFSRVDLAPSHLVQLRPCQGRGHQPAQEPATLWTVLWVSRRKGGGYCFSMLNPFVSHRDIEFSGLQLLSPPHCISGCQSMNPRGDFSHSLETTVS